MKPTSLTLAVLALGSLGAVGCASTPAAPFNTMPQAQTTVLLLQNNQAAAATSTTGTPDGTSILSSMPASIQSIITGAQSALPGLGSLPIQIPGLTLPGATTQPTPAVATFQGYPILKQNGLMDESVREQLASIFGNADNFDNSGSPCMYPEMGIGWSSSTAGAVNNEMLISFTCRTVEARTFAWPHPGRSMKQKTVQQLADLMPKLLPLARRDCAGASLSRRLRASPLCG